MAASIEGESRSKRRQPPKLRGFEQSDDGWKLRIDLYRTFIEDVTGVTVSSDISAQQIKIIQSRLEGCVEGYERRGDCLCDDFSEYEHIDSMEDVHELARLFRVFVEYQVESDADGR